MRQKITKENYQSLQWDEEISFDDSYNFYDTLSVEEQVEFLKFLLEKFPNYDEEWIEHYFELTNKWTNEGTWEKDAEFVDFVREKSPENYKKKFNYLVTDSVLLAIYHKDLETVTIRFVETVNQPVKAIDNSLRAVFNLLSIDKYYKNYTLDIAHKVWKPLEQSPNLIGAAEFDYSAFIYCNYLEELFSKIQQKETIDWEYYHEKIEAINFKLVEDYKLLPSLRLDMDFQKFHKNSKYRNEQFGEILTLFLYDASTFLGISVYWAFRTWFEILNYLLGDEEAPKRSNWFAFTPKMLDRMGGRLMGMFGENKQAMVIISFTIPYLYDFLLQRQLIDKPLFDQLMTYYQFLRRSIFKIIGNRLWQYKGLHTWEKPGFISQESWKAEKLLFCKTINKSDDEAKQIIEDYIATLDELPDEAIPPLPDPSPFEKLLNQQGVPKKKKVFSKISRPKRKRTTKPKRKKKKKKK